MRRVIVTVVATVLGLVLLLSFKTHSLTSSAAAPAVVLPAASSSAAQPSAGASSAGGFSTLDASPEPSTSAATTTGGSSATTKPKATQSTTSKPTTTKPTTTTAAPVARTIDGQAINTRYGPVQVRVSLQGSTITGITILQVPQDQQRDVQINDYAVPILTQEALKAQNAQIDMVSGATYTSQGYLQSLQSALDQAHL